LFYFAFKTNSDASHALIFGRDMQVWLVYTLIFLGLTLIAFLWVWGTALFRDINSGESVKQPWD
tara:strand:+ start:492 stop:683 length:192 start_codon:yes stop_codon:yes gene_type:complete